MSSGKDIVLPSSYHLLTRDERQPDYPGWNDLIGNLILRDAGANRPTYTKMGTSPFYGYVFVLNDTIEIAYHFNHDMFFAGEGLPKSELYLHVHWTTDGTETVTSKWQFTYTIAKGFGRGTFDVAGGGTVVTVEQAAPGVAWTHNVAEIASGIDISALEPDCLMMVQLKRITNGGTDLTDDVFVLTSDAHYRVGRYSTLNRTPVATGSFYR